ncbi:MAG: rhodanese-like domain-containing protein [Deltaproteobacteria bacterium]|nr:MAG: rhodanese-like domain-containing protein [Deltaproteobacteria bacterium]
MDGGGKSGRASAAGFVRIALEAAAMMVASSLVGLAVNLFHPRAIPYVAEKPYRTVVPCPVPGKDVDACGANELHRQVNLFVDARSRRDYEKWHVPGAMNIPYDYLEPVPQASIDELSMALSARHARKIVVYGDGRNPDSGEHLARELAEKGFGNICFVKGGAPVLMSR